jgi:A/G-specific adenine glycosylase
MTITAEKASIANGLERKKLAIQQNIILWSDLYPSRYVWHYHRSNPYQVLIGEILLDKTRHDVTTTHQRFLQFFPSFADLVAAKEEKLNEVLVSLHLEEHQWLFKQMIKGLATLGELPRDYDDIAEISGLKHEGIQAMLCFGYGLPVGVVNKHVFRMLTRIFANELPPLPSDGLIEAIGESLAFVADPQKYNRAMLDVSELICRFKVPGCRECPVNSQCDYAIDVQKSKPLTQKVA